MGNLSTSEEALKAWNLAGFKYGMIFSWIISEHKDICLELLQLILPDLGIVDVKNIKKEDTHKQNTVFHGARFDIYAEDEHGRMYDIEMQVSDEHNLGKRISYYQSYLTQHALGAGQDYNDRVDTYVIFICDFDFFGAGLPVYTTEVRVKESDLILDTGEHNIILNAKAKDFSAVSQGLAAFLKYVDTDVPTSALTCKIADDIVILKTNTQKEGDYMFYELEFRSRLARETKKVSKEARKKGLAEGRKEGREQGIVEGRKEGLTEGWAKGEKRVVCDMISRLTAKGYSKQEVITAVTELTHFTAEEATVLYDKLFVK